MKTLGGRTCRLGQMFGKALTIDLDPGVTNECPPQANNDQQLDDHDGVDFSAKAGVSL